MKKNTLAAICGGISAIVSGVILLLLQDHISDWMLWGIIAIAITLIMYLPPLFIKTK